RVDYHLYAALGTDPAYERTGLLNGGQARTNRDDGFVFEKCRYGLIRDRPLGRFGKPCRHEFRHRNGDDRKHALSSSNGHQAGARTQCGLSGHCRGSGLASRTANDENFAISALIRVRKPRWQFVRLDQMEVVILCFEKLGRISNIGENHVTGVLTIGIKDQRRFQRGERHRDIGLHSWGRNIHGNHRRTRKILRNALDNRAVETLDWFSYTRSEKRIDNDISIEQLE